VVTAEKVIVLRLVLVDHTTADCPFSRFRPWLRHRAAGNDLCDHSIWLTTLLDISLPDKIYIGRNLASPAPAAMSNEYDYMSRDGVLRWTFGLLRDQKP
jgi:hypothetical protein